MPEPSNARITVDEIAIRLRVGRQAVYRLLEDGQLPGSRVKGKRGGRWVIPMQAYETWERTGGLGRATEG